MLVGLVPVLASPNTPSLSSVASSPRPIWTTLVWATTLTLSSNSSVPKSWYWGVQENLGPLFYLSYDCHTTVYLDSATFFAKQRRYPDSFSLVKSSVEISIVTFFWTATSANP